MARVTVEDCILKIPNRFELVMLAAQRSRDIAAGAPLSVERDNDKNPVVALREIADETVEVDALRNAVIKGLQKHVEADEPEEDDIDLLAIQQEFGAAESPGQVGEGAEEADADDDEADETEAAGDDDPAGDDDSAAEVADDPAAEVAGGDDSADVEAAEKD